MSDAWICSYSLLAAILLNIVVRWIPQGKEITAGFLMAVLHKHWSSHADAAGPYLSYVFMAIAVSYCVICVYVAGNAALEARPGTTRSTVPIGLALLALLSCAGLFLNAESDLNELTWWLLAVSVLIVMLHRENFKRPDTFIKTVPRPALWAALLSFGAILGIAVAFQPVTVPRYLTTWPVVYMAVGFWTLAASLVFIALPRRYNLPSLWALPLVFVCAFSIWNDNHVVRIQNCISDAAPVMSPPPDDAQVRNNFDSYVSQWLRARHCFGSGQACTMRILATEGGGSRAAYWTAAVLFRLDKPNDSFSNSLFAVSSVSGGSLGATAYYNARDAGLKGKNATDAVYGIVADDYLSPILSSLVFGNAVQWLWPWPQTALDRSGPFEDAMSKSWSLYAAHNGLVNGDSRRFEAPFTKLQLATEPQLFLNSTNVETGRRFIISQLPLPYEDRHGAYYAFDKHSRYCIAQLPTKTAVHLSARFSFVNPAGALYEPRIPFSAEGRGRLWGRLVDGGYFDGTGLTTALDIVEAVKNSLGKRLFARCGAACPHVKLDLTYISNNPDLDETLDDPHGDPQLPLEPSSTASVPFLSGIRSVIDGVIHGTYAYDVIAQRIRARELDPNGIGQDDRHFHVISLGEIAKNLALEKAANGDEQQENQPCWSPFFGDWKPALGWWISQESISEMRDYAETYVRLDQSSADNYPQACAVGSRVSPDRRLVQRQLANHRN